jgi:hypothetical protein
MNRSKIILQRAETIDSHPNSRAEGVWGRARGMFRSCMGDDGGHDRVSSDDSCGRAHTCPCEASRRNPGTIR